MRIAFFFKSYQSSDIRVVGYLRGIITPQCAHILALRNHDPFGQRHKLGCEGSGYQIGFNLFVQLMLHEVLSEAVGSFHFFV